MMRLLFCKLLTPDLVDHGLTCSTQLLGDFLTGLDGVEPELSALSFSMLVPTGGNCFVCTDDG